MKRTTFVAAISLTVGRAYAQTPEDPPPPTGDLPDERDTAADDPGPEDIEPPMPGGEEAPGGDVTDGTVGDARVREGAQDESLESLLGLELEDTLGDTSAASRSTESVLSAPASMTLLDAQAIRLTGARTLPDLLRAAPGVQVAETAPGSFLVSLRGMHGIVGNNVVVTLEGVPLNNPFDGSIEWAAIPLDPRDLSRIELVRGPVSAVYGANAYSGVINLVTHRGYGDLPVWSARGTTTIDDRGRVGSTASLRWGQRTRGREVSLFATGGFDPVFRDASTGTNPAMVQSGALGRVAVEVGEGRLEAQIGFASLRRSSLEHLSLAREEEWREVFTARVAYTSPDLPAGLGALTVYARALDHHVPGGDARAGTGFSYADTNAFRSNLGFDLPMPVHDRFTLTVGGQLDLDSVRADYVVGADSGLLRFGYGAYVAASATPVEQLSVSAAVRVDMPTVDPEPLLSYRGALVYHGPSFALRLTAANSFRAPTYVERLGRFTDPQSGIVFLEGSHVQAPRNTTFELGATYSPRVEIQLGASVYASRLTNLILEDFFTIPRKTFVSDGADRWLGGVELDLRLELVDALHVEASASLLHYFDPPPGDPPTVAVPGQNARYSASLRLHGSARGDRLRYAFGGSFASHRTFVGAIGVPWVYQRVGLDPTALVDAMFEHVLPTDLPLWIFVRAQANPLGHTAQSFLPGASTIGSAFTFGFEVRRD